MNPKTLLLLLLLSGCAAVNRNVGPDWLSDDDEMAAAAPNTKITVAQTKAPSGTRKLVCMMERPTGSNIAERVCRYQDELDEEARQTQLGLLNMQKSCSDKDCKGK
jgi:hypothetical protein